MARTHQQTHDTGRHLAVAEAIMHGYKADLLGPSSYIEVNGHRAQVQVAAKGARQIEDIDKYTSGTIEHVVLVDVTDDLREFYVCPGDTLRDETRRRYDQFLASNQGTRPRNPDSKQAAIYPDQVRQWHNDWSRFA